jgi:hypothetical protein
MMAEDKVLEQWNKWIDRVCKDVTSLVVGRHIFKEVHDIIEGNPKIAQPSSFYEFLAVAYRDWGSMGVRRHLDSNNVSLKRLLNEMAKKPETLSRQRYLDIYIEALADTNPRGCISIAVNETQSGAHALDRSEAEQNANADFDEYAGHNSHHVPKDKIEGDISRLVHVGGRVKDFADRKIAHPVNSEPSTLPTSDDLDKCIDLMEQLVLKYERMLKGGAPQSLLPTWQYDWKAIFYDPWIPVSGLSRKV